MWPPSETKIELSGHPRASWQPLLPKVVILSSLIWASSWFADFPRHYRFVLHIKKKNWCLSNLFNTKSKFDNLPFFNLQFIYQRNWAFADSPTVWIFLIIDLWSTSTCSSVLCISWTLAAGSRGWKRFSFNHLAVL